MNRQEQGRDKPKLSSARIGALCYVMSPPACPSAANSVSSDQVSRPRKIAAGLIRGAGVLLGVVLVSLYLIIVWGAPPDMSNASPRTAFNFYVTGPLLLFCGPMFLFGWIASRIDHRRPAAAEVRLGS